MALEIKWVEYPRVRQCNESTRTSCCGGWNSSVVQNQSGSSLFLSTSMANRVWIVKYVRIELLYGVYLLVFTKVSVGLHAHKRSRDSGTVACSRVGARLFRNLFSFGGHKTWNMLIHIRPNPVFRISWYVWGDISGCTSKSRLLKTFPGGRTVPEIIALV